MQKRGEIVGIIITEADRLNVLVNDIAIMVRMDSRAITLDRREANVREVLQAAAARCSPETQKYGLDLRVDAPPGAHNERWRAADHAGARQPAVQCPAVLTRRGTVLLRSRGEKDGVRVEVLNTGEPIPAE